MSPFYLQPILFIAYFIWEHTGFEKKIKILRLEVFSFHTFGIGTAPHSVDLDYCRFQVLLTSTSPEPVPPPLPGVFQPNFGSQNSVGSFHAACHLRMAVSQKRFSPCCQDQNHEFHQKIGLTVL